MQKREAPALTLEGPALALIYPHSSPTGEETTGPRGKRCKWAQAHLGWGLWDAGCLSPVPPAS